MDIMNMATELLASKLGNSAADSGSGSDALQSALGSLLGGSSGQGIDLGSIVGSLQSSGLGDIAESWLGDGANAQISTSQIEDLLGSDKITEVASQIGSNSGDLLSGLQDLIPQMVDKSSSGGNLLDAVGGIDGLAGLAGKFFK